MCLLVNTARINKQLINYKSQSSFLGSGTAISDNLGYFSLITAYPEKINLNYINLRVQNAKIHTLQTRFYITSSDPEQYVDIVVMKK
jgi:protocatechuate 3,4-dioxygenase beta subunit